MLHHYLARGLYRKIQLLRENESKGDIQQEMKSLQSIQKYALRFWRENPHYDSLTASYKREPELLAKEAQEIADLVSSPN